MLKKSFNLLILASCFLLLSGCVAQKTHLKVADEAKRLRQVSERQEESIKSLKSKLKKTKAKKNKAEKFSKKLEKELEKAKSQKDNLEKEIADSERELSIQRQLVESLKDEIQAGKVEITKVSNQTNIRLKDSIFFDSGKATLKAAGINILKKLGNQLKTIKDRQILIEGHTDNMPLKERLKSIYSSNLELSAARSLAVAYQIQQIGIPGKRVVVLAYGQHRPIADNKSPKGRQKNRRVNIVLAKLNDIFSEHQNKIK